MYYTVQKKIKSHPDVINYFKELPFYNTYIEKPKIKPLKNKLKQIMHLKRMQWVTSWSGWEKRSINSVS